MISPTARQRGLEVWVGARAALWSYRWERDGKGKPVKLGGIDEWDITQTREIAGEAAHPTLTRPVRLDK